MNNLDKAYKAMEGIEECENAKEIKDKATKAFNESKQCIEAAIVLAKLAKTFEEKNEILSSCIYALKNTVVNNDIRISKNLTHANFELANLYYSYGMFKKALELFLLVDKEDKSLNAKYKIMTLYALFEDDEINNYYDKRIDYNNDFDYVMMSFPFMIYEYKKQKLTNVKRMMERINKRNIFILKVITGGKIKDQNAYKVKEAYQVFKNCSILINSSPYCIKYLESIC